MWNHSVVLLRRPSTGRALAESLPPSCTKLFDQLGVRKAIDGAEFIRATGNTVQWANAKPRIEPFESGVLGYQVPRGRFDAVLVAAADRAGATVIDNAVAREVERDDDGWRVTYDAGDQRRSLRARWLLDCSGRSGVVARKGWRESGSAARTTAIVAVWERRGPWPAADESHTLVESFDGGWAWSVPVSASQRFVTIMLDPTVTALRPRASLAESFEQELARTSMMRNLVDGAEMVGAPWGCDASPYSATRASGDGALLVGDAASFVDPLSSFGVKKALASAWLAAVATDTAVNDSAMTTHAMQLFDSRERAMFEHLQRQSASLARDAGSVHDTAFWRVRAGGPHHDGPRDDAAGEIDVNSLRTDPRIRSAFEEIKRRSALHLRTGDRLELVDRPVVRGHRIVLDQHLRTPSHSTAVRYCQNVDLLLVTRLAAEHEQVPDLYDAYNRVAAPAALPDFLGALSTLVGLEMLTFA
jgi:flavin-dependent dehydrogenase